MTEGLKSFYECFSACASISCMSCMQGSFLFTVRMYKKIRQPRPLVPWDRLRVWQQRHLIVFLRSVCVCIVNLSLTRLSVTDKIVCFVFLQSCSHSFVRPSFINKIVVQTNTVAVQARIGKRHHGYVFAYNCSTDCIFDFWRSVSVFTVGKLLPGVLPVLLPSTWEVHTSSSLVSTLK